MATIDTRAPVIMLCERLAAATVSRAAEWRSDSEDQYVWERDEGSVKVGSRDRDGQPPYEMAIFNSDGERVDDLVSALVDDDVPADWNAPLAELYRVARRSALGADELIDALMAALPPSAEDVPRVADGAVALERNE